MAQPFLSAFAAAVLIAAATLAPAQARADALQEAQLMMKHGQFKDALERTDQILASKPKDPQARFLKGVILTEMNHTSDAIAVFTKMTEDYPELPEPYNNLAVLYAQERQYDKAKTALEMAIRTHPAYATAYENLGDVYARMASQAYDKALQLDSSNVGAQTKLSLIRELMSVTPRQTAPAASSQAQPAKPAAAAQATPKPTPTTVAQAKPEPSIKPATELKHAQSDQKKPAEPKPVAQSPAKENKSSSKGNGTGGPEKTVEAWAAAWSHKDVKAYLAFYAKEFRTPGGESRAAWEASRSRHLKRPKSIRVRIEDLKVRMEGNDRAVATFHQHYSAPGFKASTKKVLVLVKHGDRWLIAQERVAH